ncbi:MAG TPA: DNRLRE domain-containing protein [Candidatus Acidoferrum sp.]|nr:DNRLRE domain-containing protein [Candidatus Acidoferrum sp.]
MNRSLRAAVTLFAVLVAFRSLGAAVSLVPVADTSLFQEKPNNNLGAMPFMPVGLNGEDTRGRGLIRFDLSQIPPHAMVSSATLRITSTFGGGGTRTFDIHRLLQSWIEGGKSSVPDGDGNLGQAATSGEPTWNNRQHLVSPWGAAGAAANSDYFATATATISFSAEGNYTFSSAALTADVQRWVTNAGTNFGWLLKDRTETSSGTARRIGSREDTVNAPLLAVIYTLPNPALVITNDSELHFGIIGNEYSRTLLATGGVPPYAWSVIAGTLPTGLSLSSGGAISGTPAVSGDFSFTAQVTDDATLSDTETFTVTIDPDLVISIITLANSQIEIRFTAQTNRNLRC